jgi:uncharacterized protein
MRHYAKLFRGTLTASLMLVATVGAAVAGEFEDATAAYNRGDYPTALHLISALAEQGDADAQFNLGLLYNKGKGVTQNYVEAVKWYGLAADQGHPGAQLNLGVMYKNGQGVAQNYAEAVKWYRLAADQGTAEAQYNMGIMYKNGQGVPKDDVQAHMWFNLAASQFSAWKKETRGDAIEARDFLASKMIPAQIAEAQKLAREWKPKPER